MDFKIYTKTGDDGTTGLVGGTRVKKSELRLEAYGTVDELNSWIGLIRASVEEARVKQLLEHVQQKLFIIGSKLASDKRGETITGSLKCSGEDIQLLENAIDEYEKELNPLKNFILPGGSLPVSYCHIARTICRRGERRIVQLSEMVTVDEIIVKYINRLSDYLFVLSRKVAHDTGVDEIPWISGK